MPQDMGAMATTVSRVPQVLLVEDNPDDVTLLERAFAPYQKQIDLHWVQNTISAMDFLLRRGRFSAAPIPDLVLLDLNLPIFSGHDLIRDLHRDGTWHSIPIVVLSSSNRPADINLAYQHGAMLYVVKPSNWQRWTDMAGALIKLASVQPRIGSLSREAACS